MSSTVQIPDPKKPTYIYYHTNKWKILGQLLTITGPTTHIGKGFKTLYKPGQITLEMILKKREHRLLCNRAASVKIDKYRIRYPFQRYQRTTTEIAFTALVMSLYPLELPDFDEINTNITMCIAGPVTLDFVKRDKKLLNKESRNA